MLALLSNESQRMGKKPTAAKLFLFPLWAKGGQLGWRRPEAGHVRVSHMLISNNII